MNHAIHGVHCAAATPVTTNGEPDLKLFAAHRRALVEEGCQGIAMLGTTGEANSFGLRQRMTLLDAPLDGGTPADKLLPGTSAPSVADAVELTEAERNDVWAEMARLGE